MHQHYGDFNVVLGAHERSSGIIGHASSTMEFQNFISDKDLFDIEGVGNRFTWATRRNDSYMAARLDRALASQDFLNHWDSVELLILPILCSDHSPIHLKTTVNRPSAPRPFCFQDMWTMHEDFMSLVRDCWNLPCPAPSPTLRLIFKLKWLRGKFKV